VPGEGVRRFEKEQGPVWDLAIPFRGVIGVVATDTDDLLRVSGRQNVDFVEVVPIAAERDGVAVPLARSNCTGRIAESYLLHILERLPLSR